MKDTALLIPVTFREFQVWHDSGELRVPVNRLLPVPLGHDGLPSADSLRTRELMDLLPHVDCEEEQGILIALLDPEFPAGDVPGVVLPGITFLSFARLRRLIPLTRNGKAILETRLDGYPVVLDEPLFESAVQALLDGWIRRRSLHGAQALLRLLIATPTWTPTPSLVDVALDAVLARRDSAPASLPPLPIWARLIAYDRHAPIPGTDIGYLYDLGIVLKDAAEAGAAAPLPLGPLRAVCLAPENAPRNLIDLLGDPALIRILSGFDSALGADPGLAAAMLFLKWKHEAQKAGHLDISAIRAELEAGAARFDPFMLQGAVWLTGLFFGFNQFAADYHARMAPSGCCISHRIPHEPVSLPLSAPKRKPPRKPRIRKPNAPPQGDAPLPQPRQADLLPS